MKNSMLHLPSLIVGGVLAGVTAMGFHSPNPPMPIGTTVEAVRFSPNGGGEELAVNAIKSAKEEILVQAYSFTSEPICLALAAAVKRGVNVELCGDAKSSKAKGALHQRAAQSGIKVWLDAKHPIAHSKTIVIDRRRVLTGSFNWTHNAEHANLENLWLFDSPGMASDLRENFLSHREHAERIE